MARPGARCAQDGRENDLNPKQSQELLNSSHEYFVSLYSCFELGRLWVGMFHLHAVLLHMLHFGLSLSQTVRFEF